MTSNSEKVSFTAFRNVHSCDVISSRAGPLHRQHEAAHASLSSDRGNHFRGAAGRQEGWVTSHRKEWHGHLRMSIVSAALELLDFPDNFSDSSSTQNSVTSSSFTEPMLREPHTPVRHCNQDTTSSNETWKRLIVGTSRYCGAVPTSVNALPQRNQHARYSSQPTFLC